MTTEPVTGFLQGFYARLQRFAHAFSRRRFWQFYLALLCSLYCIVTNVPQYSVLTHGQARGIAVWHRLNQQIDHPFTADSSNDPESHEALIAYRLVPPLLGKLLPTTDMVKRMQGLFVLQNMAGFFFFYLLIVFAETHFGNRLFSFLLPCCFAVLYAGKTFFFDTIFFFDGLAYLFLLASVCTRKPVWVLLTLLLAFFTDERALIGSGFVMLYHVLQQQQTKRHRAAIISVLSAVVLYVAMRLFLHLHFGLFTPRGDVHLLTTPVHTYFGFILLGIFTAFKGFWVVLLLGLFVLKGFWPRVIYSGTLLAIVLGGVSVFDFSRSISYGFIGLLAVLFYLYKKEAQAVAMNKVLVLLLAVSFLYPVYDVHRHEVFITRTPFAKYFEARYQPMPGDRKGQSVLEQSTP